jgi:hypothetical protein
LLTGSAVGKLWISRVRDFAFTLTRAYDERTIDVSRETSICTFAMFHVKHRLS